MEMDQRKRFSGGERDWNKEWRRNERGVAAPGVSPRPSAGWALQGAWPLAAPTFHQLFSNLEALQGPLGNFGNADSR